MKQYVEDFYAAVLKFLAFHPNHADMAHQLARAVAEHATPVGSGTVARTKRIWSAGVYKWRIPNRYA